MKISTYIGRKMIFEKISYIGQYSISYIGQYTTILILTDIWLHISDKIKISSPVSQKDFFTKLFSKISATNGRIDVNIS